jgi:hypothetical protein
MMSRGQGTETIQMTDYNMQDLQAAFDAVDKLQYKDAEDEHRGNYRVCDVETEPGPKLASQNTRFSILKFYSISLDPRYTRLNEVMGMILGDEGNALSHDELKRMTLDAMIQGLNGIYFSRMTNEELAEELLRPYAAE